MISYIAAANDRSVLEANLLASLELQDGDELILVENPPSIAVAYNQGCADADNQVRCFVHSDVQISDPQRLRVELLERCTDDVGMVGLIGSRTRVVPWWNGETLGSVVDARMGVLDFGTGGRCAYLDGPLLATRQEVEWDEFYPGFHFYDHDVCQQMLSRGLPNICLSDGAAMVTHNTRNSSDTSKLDGWTAGLARFNEKWGSAQ